MLNKMEVMGLIGEFVGALEKQLQPSRREPVISQLYQDEKNYCVVFDGASAPTALYDATVLHASLEDGKIYLRGQNNGAPVDGAFLSYDFSQVNDIADIFDKLAGGFSAIAGISIMAPSFSNKAQALEVY